MTIDEGTARSKARKYAERADQEISNLRTRPSEEISLSMHSFAAGDAERAAMYNLILEEFPEASEWFVSAAKQYESEAIKRPDQYTDVGDLKTSPHPLQRGLYCALVGGDSGLGEEIATEILSFDRTFPHVVEHTGEEVTVEADPDRYHHMRILAGLVLNEPRVVNESAAALHGELDRIDELSDRQRRYGIETDILGAILNDDTSQVIQRITDVLALHEAGIRDPSNPTADEAVCLEAIGLIILARRRGLDVTVDSEFVPARYVSFVLDE